MKWAVRIERMSNEPGESGTAKNFLSEQKR